MDTQQQINELRSQIEELKSFIQLLMSSGTLPRDIEVSIKERLNIPDSFIAYSSVNSSPSVTAVNEAGSAVYNVAAPMVGFLFLTVNGTTYKLARY